MSNYIVYITIIHLASSKLPKFAEKNTFLQQSWTCQPSQGESGCNHQIYI